MNGLYGPSVPPVWEMWGEKAQGRQDEFSLTAWFSPQQEHAISFSRWHRLSVIIVTTRATRIVNLHESVKRAVPSVPVSAGGSVFLPGLDMRKLKVCVDKAPASSGN